MSGTWDREKYPFLNPVKGDPSKGTLWTPLFDPRFPTTNQSRNCWSHYVEFQRCRLSRSEDHPDCRKFYRTYMSLCPQEWVCIFYFLNF